MAEIILRKFVVGYYIFFSSFDTTNQNKRLSMKRNGFRSRGQVLKDEYFWGRGTENLNFASTLIDALKARNQSFYSVDLISPVVSSLYGAPLFQSLCIV